MTRLSFSKIQTYNKCPRKYYYSGDSTTPEDDVYDSRAMELGSLVHKGFEVALHYADDKPMQHALDDLDNNILAMDTNTVKAMLTSYIPYMGIGTRIKPLRLSDGSKAIELKFEYQIEGFTLAGVIDAVVLDVHGNVILIDWKSRGRLMDCDDVRYDYQLYVYAHVLEVLYGIKPDKIMQIQMSTTPPATPTRNLDGQWSKRLGKTTKAILDSYDDIPETLYDKVTPLSDFVAICEIDTYLVPMMFNRFLLTARTMINDTVMRPVHDAYTCKFCQYKNSCLTSYTHDAKISLSNT